MTTAKIEMTVVLVNCAETAAIEELEETEVVLLR